MISISGKNIAYLFFLFSLMLLSACGEEDSFVGELNEEQEEARANTLNAGAVKGPLINATVRIYSVDLEDKDFQTAALAEHGLRKILFENGIVQVDGDFTLSGDSANALRLITERLGQSNYTGALLSLQNAIADEQSLTDARALINSYLAYGNTDSSDGNPVACEEPLCESNSYLKRQVETINNGFNNLNELKERVLGLQTLGEEFQALDSFSELKRFVAAQQENEQSALKKLNWSVATNQIIDIESNLSNLSVLKQQYEQLHLVLTGYEEVTQELNLVALNRLRGLREDIEDATSVEELESLLLEAFRKEEILPVVQGIKSLYDSIVTFEDALNIVRIDESLYALEVNEGFSSCTDLAQCALDESSALSGLKKAAFQANLVEPENERGEVDNQLSFGTTKSEGFELGLLLNDYDGFVYLNVELGDQTVDLNGTQEKLFDNLDMIFHTDDIKGYGNNSQFDESIYFYVNGVLQRDIDGNIITDSNEISSANLANNTLVTVYPHRFATPWTKLSLALSLENLASGYESDFIYPSLSSVIDPGINDSLTASNYSFGEKLSQFSSDAFYLNELFKSSRRTVNSSLNVTDVEFDAFNSTSPLILSHMDIETDKLKQTVAMRANIEYFGGLLALLSEQARAPSQLVFTELVEDLTDKAFDAKRGEAELPYLSAVKNFDALFDLTPQQINIPGTNSSVANVMDVIRSQFSDLLPEINISDFEFQEDPLFSSPLAGVDFNGNGVIDKFESDLLSDDVVETLLVDQNQTVMPLTGGVDITIPLIVSGDDEVTTCGFGDVGYQALEACIVASGSVLDLDVSASLVESPDLAEENVAVDARLVTSGNSDVDGLNFRFFADQPGDYIASLTIKDNRTGNTLNTNFSILVIDAASLQFQLGSTNQERLEPLNSGSVPTMFVRATSDLCKAYAFCSEADVGELFDSELLGSALTIKWIRVNDDGNYGIFTSIDNLRGDGDASSNITEFDRLQAVIFYDSGTASYELGTTENRADADLVDIFPEYDNCSNVQDGIENAESFGVTLIGTDGNVVSCFADLIADQSRLDQVISMPEFGETWFYKKGWGFVIRQNNSRDQFIGSVPLPKDQFGNYIELSAVNLVDELNRRLYLSYDSGVVYFDFGIRELKSFVEGSDIVALTKLYEFIFIDFQNGSKAYDLNGTEMELATNALYPFPDQEIPVFIGDRRLSDLSGDVQLSAKFSALDRTESISEIIRIDQDTKSIPAGITQFGDVVEVSLNYVNSEGDAKFISNELYVLGLSRFILDNNPISLSSPLGVIVGGDDTESQNALVSKYISVYWSRYDSDSNSYVRLGASQSLPFTLSESVFSRGDYIKADIVLENKGVNGEDRTFVIETDFALMYEDIGRSLVELFSILADGEDLTVSSREEANAAIVPSRLLEFLVSEGHVNPVWYLNGQEAEGEDQWSFPALYETQFKFGHQLTFGLNYNLNGGGGSTNTQNVLSLTVTTSVQIELEKNVVASGDVLRLNPDIFDETAFSDFFLAWYVNGAMVSGQSGFEFSTDGLVYGDKVELKVSSDLEFENDNSLFASVGTAYVGVNQTSILNDRSSGDELDDDGDGVANYRDYYRNDANCWVPSAGNPDDLDRDGLSDLEELSHAMPSNPGMADTDGDGLSDYFEIKGLDAYGESHAQSNPSLADTDGDGYNDLVERLRGTDPNVAEVLTQTDSDFDGLSDQDELDNNTLIMQSDSDGDGVVDGAEVAGISGFTFDVLNPDTDNDGLSDGLELFVLGTDPDVADHDSDGLSDSYEILVSKTDPKNADNVDNLDQSNYRPSSILYSDDLGEFGYSRKNDVEPGTCYETQIARSEGGFFASSLAGQTSNSASGYLVWGHKDWSYLIVLRSGDMQFVEVVNLANATPASVSSLKFSTSSDELLYVGFSDGTIRNVSLDSESEVQVAPQQDSDYSVDFITETGDSLIVISNENRDYSILEYADGQSFQLSSKLDLSSIQENEDRTKLWAYDENGALQEMTLNDAQQSLVMRELSDVDSLLAPAFYYSSSLDELIFSDGSRFDLNTRSVFDETENLPAFSQGVEYIDTQLRVSSDKSTLQLLTLSGSDWNWNFSQSLGQLEVKDVSLLGGKIVVITENIYNNSLGFYLIDLIDNDSNNVPDWFDLAVDGADSSLFEGDRAITTSLMQASVSREFFTNTAPSEDFDGDGVSNEDELSVGSCSSPYHCSDSLDTDNDGLSDYFEYTSILEDPLAADFVSNVSALINSADADSDGLTDYQEVMLENTDPLSQDSDGDNICDAHEVLYLNTNPNNADSDSDGLDDNLEWGVTALNCQTLLVTQYSNPNNADSDFDGLSDLDEYNNQIPIASFNRTNALLADTDGDGFTDKQEIDRATSSSPIYSTGINPLVSDAIPAGEDSDVDTDSDGLIDSYELNVSLTDINNVDTDGDGVRDGFEVNTLGSNPLATDTDGDRICDYFDRSILDSDIEAENGFDILDKAKYIAFAETVMKSDDPYQFILGTNVNASDSDEDGVSDSFELGLGESESIECGTSVTELSYISFPTEFNSDEDSLDDGFEWNYVFGQYNPETFPQIDIAKTTIDPLLGDTDGDGVCDHIEVNDLGSNPAEPDTDFDTLSDQWELGYAVGCETPNLEGMDQAFTSLMLVDSDFDGLTDAQERGGNPALVLSNTDPNDPDSNDNGILDGDEDTDGDGLKDKDEFNLVGTRYDLADTDSDGVLDNLEDADADGLTNELEVLLGTCSMVIPYVCLDPLDSDGDGVSDFDEVRIAVENGIDINPTSSDSDEDGISDFDEISRVTTNESEICYIRAIQAGDVLIGSGDSVPCATNPNAADSDSDGINDFDELVRGFDPNHPDTDRDFLLDGEDRSPGLADSDFDGIPDGFEEHVLGSDHTRSDTDNDGIADGIEVWLFAYETGDGNIPFRSGISSDLGGGSVVDSRSNDISWSIYKRNSLENVTSDRTVVYLKPLFDTETNELNQQIIFDEEVEGTVAKVYVQKFADPTNKDTDNDGLDDFIELFKIEARYGTSNFVEYEAQNTALTDVNASCLNSDYDTIELPELATFNPNLSNSENFTVSNPNVNDTNQNGISDAYEDADQDFWVNVEDQTSSPDSIVISDIDKDCLLDGVEMLVLRTQVGAIDSDLDGISDNLEVSELDLENPREIRKDKFCDSDEIRVSNAQGSDYCFNVTYYSNPNASDSDGDGVNDALPGISSEGDFFPLDASCSEISDGVVGSSLADSYCYSTWLAQQNETGTLVSGNWLLNGVSNNYVAFFDRAWDRIIHLNFNEMATDWSYEPHIPVVGLTSAALSPSQQRLFYSTNQTISYVDLTDNSQINDVIELNDSDVFIDEIFVLGTHLLIQTHSIVDNSYNRILYDSSFVRLDTSTSLSGTGLDKNSIQCATDSCDATVVAYGVSNVAGQVGELSSLQIDLVNEVFGSSASTNVFNDNSVYPGEILGASEDKSTLYFSEGRKMSVGLSDPIEDTLFSKQYLDQTFTEFFKLHEENQHFVAIVDNLVPSLPGGQVSDKVVFVENLARDGDTQRYRIEDDMGADIVDLVPFRVNGLNDLFWMNKTSESVDFTTVGISDQDGDGMPGVFEMQYGMDDTDALDRFADADSDGLTNYEEFLYSTNPTLIDSDSDGVTDLQEVTQDLLN